MLNNVEIKVGDAIELFEEIKNNSEMVLDPFSGSGTTLRVCQQLNRNCIGFEINPSYVEMIKNRLSKPFDGFESIAPRMERIPLDLRDDGIRQEYLANHIKWFLNRHNGLKFSFLKSVEEMYGDNTEDNLQKTEKQGLLFD